MFNMNYNKMIGTSCAYSSLIGQYFFCFNSSELIGAIHSPIRYSIYYQLLPAEGVDLK